MRSVALGISPERRVRRGEPTSVREPLLESDGRLGRLAYGAVVKFGMDEIEPDAAQHRVRGEPDLSLETCWSPRMLR